MRWLPRDLRLAIRGLLAGRLTTLVAVLTLALGIGVGTAVFSVLDSVLVRPVPFRDGARYAEMWNFNEKGHFYYAGFTPDLVRVWRSQTDIFDRVEAYNGQSIVYAASEGAEIVSGAAITPGLFAMLGVAPSAGRLFVSGEGQTGADHLAIVSNRFWRTRLHRAPDAVGRRLTLNAESYLVVGVMPASFRFPSETEDVWVPYDVDRPPSGDVDASRLEPFARLRPGVDFTSASKAVTLRGARLSEAAGASAAVSAMLIEPAQLGDKKTRASLLVLAGAVGFLLLIVCANLANLTLSRSLTRAKDMAIRAALGASRWDLIRSACIEHLLLAAVGTAAGLVVAEGVLTATLTVLPESMIASTLNAIDLDGRAVAFSAITSALCVIAFGLPPAFVASRAAITDVLRRDSRSIYYPFGAASDALHAVMATSIIGEYRTIIIRAGAPAMTMAQLPRAVHAIDPSIVIANTDLVDHVYADALARPRIVFLMMSVFAIFGWILAAAGIYGVLSCLVQQRLREIGIRIALGASRRHAGRLILGSGLSLTGAGLVVGVGLAMALVRVMRTLLYDVEPSDPLSIGLVAALLLATALVAAWVPARRAMRVDPVSLLRED